MKVLLLLLLLPLVDVHGQSLPVFKQEEKSKPIQKSESGWSNGEKKDQVVYTEYFNQWFGCIFSDVTCRKRVPDFSSIPLAYESYVGGGKLTMTSYDAKHRYIEMGHIGTLEEKKDFEIGVNIKWAKTNNGNFIENNAKPNTRPELLVNNDISGYGLELLTNSYYRTGYRFGITGAGQFSIDKLLRDNIVHLKEWSSSSAILKTKLNHLKISKSEKELLFFINEKKEPVFRVSFLPDEFNGIGFGFFVDGNQTVFFQKFQALGYYNK